MIDYICGIVNSEISVAEIAFDIVENTRRNVYLTGEAGTGKTTFLKRVLQDTEKKCVVVAPTGVAAINAGGSTIHSMFGLPTRMFLPTMHEVDPNQAQNIPMLQSHFRYPKIKLDLFKNLDLLVIDEISMVRADLFDAIDESLRFSRRSKLPFGGVQLLLIGDLYQLPPVVKQNEKPLLDNFYDSEFFFDSRAYADLNVLQLKLDKVYRQTHRTFISLLNNIRNATLEESDYEILQERYQPDFVPKEDGFVILCSHNSTTERINKEKLEALQGVTKNFQAEITGDFFESQYPIEPILTLKLGAQVMFIKNDISGEKKYYNGKIGIVTSMDSDVIVVEDPKNGDLIEVKKDNWQNLKYKFDAVTDAVSQEEVGNFKHFPLKLAWAITIHKSQGLTLEKVIIDAEKSFAPGQVYVALSRAVSLDGLYLKSGITGRNIFLDPRIVAYSQNNAPANELGTILEKEKRIFGQQKLISKFEFEQLRNFTVSWYYKLERKSPDIPQDIKDGYYRHLTTVNELEKLMMTFRKELNGIFSNQSAESLLIADLIDRGGKAIKYSINRMNKELFVPSILLMNEYNKKGKGKKWGKVINELIEASLNKRDQLLKIAYRSHRLHPEDIGRPITADLDVPSKSEYNGKQSIEITLDIYLKTKNIEQTAKERGLVNSTIESHLAKLVEENKLSVSEFLSEGKLSEMTSQIPDFELPLSEIRIASQNQYSYFDIRLARIFLKQQNASKNEN